MSKLHVPRIERTYALPAPAYDTLVTYRRFLQNAADLESGTLAREGDAGWVSNSQALAHVLQLVSNLAHVATSAGMFPAAFVTALKSGDLVAAPREVQA